MLAIAFCALHHCLMLFREARTEEAVEACHVVRRSITELCLADHQDDPAILEKWLANKTPTNVRSWIARPDAHMFVATTPRRCCLTSSCVRRCSSSEQPIARREVSKWFRRCPGPVRMRSALRGAGSCKGRKSSD